MNRMGGGGVGRHFMSPRLTSPPGRDLRILPNFHFPTLRFPLHLPTSNLQPPTKASAPPRSHSGRRKSKSQSTKGRKELPGCRDQSTVQPLYELPFLPLQSHSMLCVAPAAAGEGRREKEEKRHPERGKGNRRQEKKRKGKQQRRS